MSLSMLEHRWYTVQTTSGHENKVLRLIQRKIDMDPATPEDRLIRQALVPTQEVVEIKNGKKVTVERKIFPGYVLVEMVASQDTLHEINAIQGSANFGGVNGTGNTEGSLKKSLSTESELIEVGSKASLFENKVFVSGSLFQQTRLAPQLVGNPIGIETKGVELESFYQPNRNFNASANFTYQNAEQDDFGYQQTGSYLDGYPVGFLVDGVSSQLYIQFC